MSHYNTHDADRQPELAERNHVFNNRKLLSLKIAELYEKCGAFYSYGGKIRGCAENMILRSYETGEKEIEYTLFCGCRLCPVCQARRSLKSFAQLSQILDFIDAERVKQHGKPYEYILITLTLQSFILEDLQSLLDMLIEAQQKVIRTKAWQNAIKGAWRTLEITYNEQMNTVHPHLHFLCAVNPSYFTSKDYISQDKLAKLWMKSAKVPYKPIVDIRRVKTLGGAKAEVSKYITKPLTALFDLPETTGANFIKYLHAATYNRKSCASYGVIREAFRKLHFSDEDGQLLDVTEGDKELLAKMRPDVKFIYELISWDSRAYEYKPMDDIALATAFPSSNMGMIRKRLEYLANKEGIEAGEITREQVYDSWVKAKMTK